jgi:hypothetical protein
MTLDELKNLPGPRVFALFNLLLLQVGGLGVTLFWAFGLFLLLTKNGGQVQDVITGTGRSLFYLYPVALVVFSLIGWLAFWRKRDLFALAMMSAPIGLVVLYYLFSGLRPYMYQ